MNPRPKNRSQSVLFAVFAVLLLGIGMADYFFYRSQSETTTAQAQQQLSAIADLKIQQISNWRKERLGDAHVLRENIFAQITVADWLRLGLDQAQQNQISAWLQSYVRQFDYREALLLDPQGEILAATPETLPILEETLQLLQAAAESGEPELSDLRISIGMDSYIELVTPLYNETRERLLGFIVFRITPQHFLFPLIQSWPVPSDSAETLLVERRGNDVLFLNELRHQKGTGLRLTLPIDQDDLPAAFAARGETRVMAGRDYRNVEVLAATRPVPGTPWSMVAKIDMREVRAPLVERFSFLLIVSVLALLAALGVTLYLSRLQRNADWRHKEAERKASHEMARAHERLVAAQDIGHSGSWERELGSEALWWSEGTYRLFDFPQTLTKPTLELFYSRIHPEDRERVSTTIIQSAADGKSYHIAYRVILPSGEIRHFENTSRIIRDSAGYPTSIAGTTQDVTNRKQAELELQRQHALLNTIIQNMPNGVSMIDEELNFIAFNREFCRLLEFPVELMAQKPLSMRDVALFNARRGEYGPGDPEQLVNTLIDKARYPVAHHFERTRPNGTTIEVRGTPLPDGGFVTTYTDISARKRDEQALQALSERLTLATSAAEIGIWDWSLDGDSMIWDARMFELYGICPNNGEDAHRQWIRHVHPDDLALVQACLQSCYTGHAKHLNIDFRIVRPDGQLRFLNTQLHIERDTEYKPLRIVGANIDITVRKQSEERLLLAEKVFDNSPDAIMITDQDNHIVSSNEAFTLITGYAPGEVLGQDPRILASGQHDSKFYQQMWGALQHRGHWAGEVIDRRKSGDFYPKWMTINAVTDQRSGKLTHYVSIFSDITERKSAEERIYHLAHHDALTGLPNRFSLETRLEQACMEARRHSWKLAVLFIDLDRFKVINDTLGHQMGDQLLIEVTRRLSDVVRESDAVGRLGGDEFVIILQNMHAPTNAANVASKIIEALAEPIIIDKQQLHTSPSIGISVFPSDGSDANTIMRNADTAMYHAKGLGRNNFQFYSEKMNRNASERLDIENRLRHALPRGEFELHYQPQLTTQGTQVVGVEALLRWNTTDGRSVPPARFIPIAEETGMIIAIGEWVLRTACQQVKQWIDAGVPPLRLAVNVSARQLRKQDFPDVVASALNESGLPAQLLEIEITESAVMEEPEEARLILERLKKMGVTLAIDDFGTGYSSLAYLKLFPIDNLKIDRSFVTDIGRHADDAAIAISTIALAHSLGINVIAEGVETSEQHALLRMHHCDELQGFLFSRPLAAKAALTFLRQAAAKQT